MTGSTRRESNKSDYDKHGDDDDVEDSEGYVEMMLVVESGIETTQYMFLL